MPQMAPIAWLILFLVFSFTLIMFNFLNYYTFTPEAPQYSRSQMKHNNPMSWKW